MSRLAFLDLGIVEEGKHLGVAFATVRRSEANSTCRYANRGSETMKMSRFWRVGLFDCVKAGWWSALLSETATHGQLGDPGRGQGQLEQNFLATSLDPSVIWRQEGKVFWFMARAAPFRFLNASAHPTQHLVRASC